MSGAALNPTLAPYFVQAGARNHIPPAVLAGVADVETDGGRNLAVSSTGAQGPMQFEPPTAAELGINPNDPAQAVDGAARLLNRYGFQSNPTRAIAAYNAGPVRWTVGLGYAHQVLSSASRLAPALAGFGVGSYTGGVASVTPTGSSTGGSSSYGGLGGFLLRSLLTVALIGAGLALAFTGGRNALEARKAPA